jgi:RNA polymerase sigma-70 factor (ECF subfamily)
VRSVREATAAAAREHERYLWGVCYRMTGSAADADDLVQETFARALERPPADASLPLRPWLTRVAVNLAKDHLRARRRRGYLGPWLPAPIETGEEVAAEPVSTEGRYDLLESVSYAFLLALEALTPQQRAVLLLRDVFDYSVEEAAEALSLSPSNVKVTHHRARKALTSYDRQRAIPTRDLQERTRAALEQLMTRFVTRDVTGIEELLSTSIRELNDGGSEFHAAKVPLVGIERVVKFHLRLGELRGAPDTFEVRMLNGLPALLATYAPERVKAHEAPRFVLRLDVDPDGRIRELHAILATEKIRHLFPERAEP